MRPPDPAPGRYVAIGVRGSSRVRPHRCRRGRSAGTPSGQHSHASGPAAGALRLTVSDGPYHTCALTKAGEAACWGWNNFGPSPDVPAGRYIAISAGIPHLRHHRVQRAGVLGRGPCSDDPIPGRGRRRSCVGLLRGQCGLTRGRRGPSWHGHTHPSPAKRTPGRAHGDQPRLGACVRHRRVGRGGVLGPPTRPRRAHPRGAIPRPSVQCVGEDRQLRVRCSPATGRRGAGARTPASTTLRPVATSRLRGRRARLRTHRRRRGGVLGPPPRLERLRPDRSPAGPLRGDQRGLGPHLRRRPRRRRSSAGATRTTSCGRSHRCSVPPLPSQSPRPPRSRLGAGALWWYDARQQSQALFKPVRRGREGRSR